MPKQKKETQKSVAKWCRETFPQYCFTKQSQAISIVEEAVELAVASGCDKASIDKAVTVTLDKALSTIYHNRYEELADVAINALSYAEMEQKDLMFLVELKMLKNRAKPKTHYQKKHDAKLKDGLRLR